MIDRRMLVKSAVAYLAFAPIAADSEPARVPSPFALGIASGDPTPTGFVLWTRLTLTKSVGGADTPSKDIGIKYEIASDPSFQVVVSRGTAIAEAAFGYSVHHDVVDLEPGRAYWYRFRLGHFTSAIGRAVTTPLPGAGTERLRIAVAACANYESGYFTAYANITDDAPDLVMFIGDYIYEAIDERQPPVRGAATGPSAMTLEDYRARYELYRSDSDLQRLHAECPVVATWDDHEVENDYAANWSSLGETPEQFSKRRAAAYQAFYEFMPLRPARSTPRSNGMRIFDRLIWGDLATIYMLDVRQYRSRLACNTERSSVGAHRETISACPEVADPARTMLGEEQELWLRDEMSRSRSAWNLLAQGVPVSRLAQIAKSGELSYWTGDWDGYPAARDRLFQSIESTQLRNPVMVSGDIHAFVVSELKRNFSDPLSATIGTEFVVTSVTAKPPPQPMLERAALHNTNVKYAEARHRGYLLLDVSKPRLTAELRSVGDAKVPRAEATTIRTFTVSNGVTGIAEGD